MSDSTISHQNQSKCRVRVPSRTPTFKLSSSKQHNQTATWRTWLLNGCLSFFFRKTTCECACAARSPRPCMQGASTCVCPFAVLPHLRFCHSIRHVHRRASRRLPAGQPRLFLRRANDRSRDWQRETGPRSSFAMVPRSREHHNGGSMNQNCTLFRFRLAGVRSSAGRSVKTKAVTF